MDKKFMTRFTKLLSIITTITFTIVAIPATAAEFYNCELNDYRAGQSGNRILQSWVPEQVAIEKLNNNVFFEIFDNRLGGQITRNTSGQFEFITEMNSTDNKGRELIVTYVINVFSSNGRIRVSPRIKGSADIGEVWGQCNVRKISNPETSSNNSASDAKEHIIFEWVDLSHQTYNKTSSVFGKSDFIKRTPWSSKTRRAFKKLQGKDTLQVWIAPAPCETFLWWSYPTKSTKHVNKWKSKMVKRLRDFPEATVDFCTKTSDVIVDGRMTTNPVNDNYISRIVGTAVLRDKSSLDVHPVVIEQDYLGNRTGGAIYDKNLQKLCEFAFSSDDTASLRCRVGGEIKAKFQVLNTRTGEFKLFGKSDTHQFFATNLSIRDTKRKYPKVVR